VGLVIGQAPNQHQMQAQSIEPTLNAGSTHVTCPQISEDLSAGFSTGFSAGFSTGFSAGFSTGSTSNSADRICAHSPKNQKSAGLNPEL